MTLLGELTVMIRSAHMTEVNQSSSGIFTRYYTGQLRPQMLRQDQPTASMSELSPEKMIKTERVAPTLVRQSTLGVSWILGWKVVDLSSP
jgi:hypothetical protein